MTSGVPFGVVRRTSRDGLLQLPVVSDQLSVFSSCPALAGLSLLSLPECSPNLVTPFLTTDNRQPTTDNCFLLPGRLCNAWNLALQRQRAEAQAAEAELAQIRPRTSANLAAVMLPGRKLGFLVRLGDTRCPCHCFLYQLPASRRQLSQLDPFALNSLLLAQSLITLTAPSGTASPSPSTAPAPDRRCPL